MRQRIRHARPQAICRRGVAQALCADAAPRSAAEVVGPARPCRQRSTRQRSRVRPTRLKDGLTEYLRFGDHKLFNFLDNGLGFDYVIRFRGNIHVTDANGETRPASEWVGKGGRARTLRHGWVTEDHYEVGTVVCVHAKDMKEPWCIAASDPQAKARTLINHYAKRWTIEPSFRDSKDLRFGMGMSATHIRNTQRRDRLFLVNAFAIVLLTLLGAAGESLGYDRHLKANTVKRRTHSLFRQGCTLFDLIPNMPESRLRPLLERFAEHIRAHRSFSDVLCVV